MPSAPTTTAGTEPSTTSNAPSGQLIGRDSARTSSAGAEPFVHPVEETPPAIGRALVLLGRHRPALLEVHLGPFVAESSEHDLDEFIGIFASRIGHSEDEPFGCNHLEVLAFPVDPAPIGRGEHRQPPFAAWAHVHRHAFERHLALRAAVPVGEALGLGPFPPNPLARSVEHPADPDPVFAGPLSHWSRVVPRVARRRPPRTGDRTPTSPRHPSAAPRGAATDAAVPNGCA